MYGSAIRKHEHKPGHLLTEQKENNYKANKNQWNYVKTNKINNKQLETIRKK